MFATFSWSCPPSWSATGAFSSQRRSRCWSPCCELVSLSAPLCCPVSPSTPPNALSLFSAPSSLAGDDARLFVRLYNRSKSAWFPLHKLAYEEISDIKSRYQSSFTLCVFLCKPTETDRVAFALTVDPPPPAPQVSPARAFWKSTMLLVMIRGAFCTFSPPSAFLLPQILCFFNFI